MDSKLNSFSPSLKGSLLLAMPGMDDPRFRKSVIFLAAHDQKGAMGISINQPLATLDFPNVLAQVGIESEKISDTALKAVSVGIGGPIEPAHGFLLHSADFSQKDTIQIDDLFGISGTVDSLRAIVSGYRPQKMLFALGYAGWAEGQLEQEIQDNVWITVPANHEIVFNTDPDHIWEKAFAALGVSPSMISISGGRA